MLRRARVFVVCAQHPRQKHDKAKGTAMERLESILPPCTTIIGVGSGIALSIASPMRPDQLNYGFMKCMGVTVVFLILGLILMSIHDRQVRDSEEHRARISELTGRQAYDFPPEKGCMIAAYCLITISHFAGGILFGNFVHSVIAY